MVKMIVRLLMTVAAPPPHGQHRYPELRRYLSDAIWVMDRDYAYRGDDDDDDEVPEMRPRKGRGPYREEEYQEP